MGRLKGLLRRLRAAVASSDPTSTELFRRLQEATTTYAELRARAAENAVQRSRFDEKTQAVHEAHFAEELAKVRAEMDWLNGRLARRASRGVKVRRWRAQPGSSSTFFYGQQDEFVREALPSQPRLIEGLNHTGEHGVEQTLDWVTFDADLTDGLPVEERQQLAAEAASTINHTLARLLVQLGPPPEGAGGGLSPVTSGGGGGAQQ
ncbi:hypothetical protein [Streptomyces cadmiisoli]|uniref:hypothetical protein n=1 Tax=Streptomyces cadmiisoli TaxID=2184053 RepID=UPI0036669A2E